ncbi:MAG: xanthine dehydrogenase family protein subunit M [Alphaproteobacteria bacterium]|nr:MAG: xanthine dehydrogenase family protein subunit M [Alphaproteobacteria bacterium]
MYPFSFKRAATVAEAADLFKGSDDPQYLAGGQTLIPTLKQRLAAPSDLIEVSRIESLKGISEDGGQIVIGAGVSHAEVAASELVRARIPGLAGLAGEIGDPHVRHRGTLGGSIANNDPAADYPAAVLALGAEVRTAARSIAADDYFLGMFETALEEGELITSVAFKVPEASAYAKFPNPASRYAMVGVFVAKFADGVRVAVTGAGPGVFRVPEMEAALSADFSESALHGISVSAEGLNSDLHGSADYRAHLVGVMARRAVAVAR